MKNNDMICIRKKLTEYQAVIIDVDGTLYSQPKLRLYMLRSLLTYYICHPHKIKDLLILTTYRSSRERWENIVSKSSISAANESDLEEAQYAYVAKRTRSSIDYIKQLVLYWLHSYPLSYLAKCQDMTLTEIIKFLQDNSITVAIYSDYPSKSKLEALKINPDYIFSSSDEEINCMKPSEEAMKTILSILHTDSENALMIGDRFCKDGVAAQNMGMDFVILPKSIPNRTQIYKFLMNASKVLKS